MSRKPRLTAQQHAMRKATARERQRNRKLFRELAAAPAVTVSGIVHGYGASGSQTQGEKDWAMSFWFDGWRIAGRPLQTTRLIVRKRVGERALQAWMKSIRPGRLLRVRARVVEEPFADPRALLIRVLGPETRDGELLRYAASLKAPVIHKDPVLGALTFDRTRDWWEGQVPWNGRRTVLYVDAPRPSDLGPALQTAHALWRNQRRWQGRVARCALSKLLPLRNGTWLLEDEKPTSKAEFLRKLRLQTISVTPGGGFSFEHNDGDLFAGHSIVIRGNIVDGPKDADIGG